MRVTGCRFHFEDALLDGQDGDIECSTTEIEDQDVAFGGDFLVETVGNGGSCRLVDDTQHVEAGDDTRVLRRLTLRIIEVSGHSDHGFGDLFTKVRFGDFFHFRQHHRGDFLGRELFRFIFVFNLNLRFATLADHFEGPVLHVRLNGRIFEFTSDETLGIEDGVVRIHRHLILGGITDQTFAIREGDVGRRGAVALIVGNDFDFAVLEDTNALDEIRHSWEESKLGRLTEYVVPKSIPIALRTSAIGIVLIS